MSFTKEEQMPRTASLARRLLLCLLVVATLATAAYSTTASAAATPVPIYHQETDVGPNPDPQPCTGVSGGTLTNTVTEQGHTVTNADGAFHIFLTVTQNIREDWTDGTYLIAQAVFPETFNINATGTNPFSGAEQFRGTLYSPTGQTLGDLDIFSEFHYTIVDGTFVSNANQFRIIRSPC
jgi:hypothetical protein